MRLSKACWRCAVALHWVGENGGPCFRRSFIQCPSVQVPPPAPASPYMTCLNVQGNVVWSTWGQRPAEADQSYGKLLRNSDPQAQSAPKGASCTCKGTWFGRPGVRGLQELANHMGNFWQTRAHEHVATPKEGTLSHGHQFPERFDQFASC